MNRRLAAAGIALVAVVVFGLFPPFIAGAQQSALPVIGYLSARSPDDSAHLLTAFRRGFAHSPSLVLRADEVIR